MWYSCSLTTQAFTYEHMFNNAKLSDMTVVHQQHKLSHMTQLFANNKGMWGMANIYINFTVRSMRLMAQVDNRKYHTCSDAVWGAGGIRYVTHIHLKLLHSSIVSKNVRPETKVFRPMICYNSNIVHKQKQLLSEIKAFTNKDISNEQTKTLYLIQLQRYSQ